MLPRQRSAMNPRVLGTNKHTAIAEALEAFNSAAIAVGTLRTLARVPQLFMRFTPATRGPRAARSFITWYELTKCTT